MYQIILEEETSTGFRYVNIVKELPEGKEGFKLLHVSEFSLQKDAINCLLRGRRETQAYNVSLDPDYIPPSKRRTSHVVDR